MDNLLDRDCVLLDGKCDCTDPFQNCKRYSSEQQHLDVHEVPETEHLVE
jgi:hypothetical protein